jgi:hypothetical protein
MGHQTVTAAGRSFLAVSGALVDTCRIEHLSGTSTNGTTGVVTKTYTIVYSGQCRIQAATANWAGPTEVGEAALRLAAAELQLPVHGSENILIDDRVTILTCANDTELVGRIYSVTGPSHKSQATTRKIPLQEVLS